MDKRLSLALLLTALVVAVTPILFPTPRRTPAADSRADSVADTISSRPVASAQAPAAAPPSLPVVDSSVPSANTATVPSNRPAEVITLSSQRSTYRFSNVGAAPVAVEFAQYKQLAPARRGNVELTVGGAGLLSYALVVPGDTISLANIPFSS